MAENGGIARLRWSVLPLLAAAIAFGAPAAVNGAAVVPDDPGLPLQWSLARTGAVDAWQVGTGNGVRIAIVDSGVDLAHEDFRAGRDGPSRIVGHVSCIGSRGDWRQCRGAGQDDNGHGTHVAGIAGATTNNGRGVAGVAPGAELLSVRVLENDCQGIEDVAQTCDASGAAEDVAAGMRWAVENGADVVNLSLGNTTQSVFGPAFEDAIDQAWSRGVIAVVATGNDVLLPSGFESQPAVVVAATTRDDRAAWYSNPVGRAKWAIAAPGGEDGDRPQDCSTGGTPRGVLSAYWNPRRGPNQYACLAGTSMAAPHVSGALAVLRGLGLPPQQAIDRLLGTAEDLGERGRDEIYGSGRINLARAVAGLAPAARAGDTGTGPVPGGPGAGSPGAGSGAPAGVATSPTTAPAPAEPAAGDQPPAQRQPAPDVGTDPAEDAAPASLGRRAADDDDSGSNPLLALLAAAMAMGATVATVRALGLRRARSELG